jgi:hypothetical protein
MFYESNHFLTAVLTEIKTAILLTTGAGFKVKLAQTPFSPNPGSVPSTDFTEADYTGYAAVVLTTMTPNTVTGNSYETTSTTVAVFQPSGTTVANNIGGYWVEDDSGAYLGYEVLPTPIALNGPTTYLSIVPRWLSSPTTWPNTILP